MNQKLRFLYFIGIRNSFLSVWAKLGYSQIKDDHIADSLLKDAVLMVGVNLRLSSFSVLLSSVQKSQGKIFYHKIPQMSFDFEDHFDMIWCLMFFISCCKSFNRPWTWALALRIPLIWLVFDVFYPYCTHHLGMNYHVNLSGASVAVDFS